MSSKTSFRLVVTLAGRVLQENRFSISPNAGTMDIKEGVASALDGRFNSASIKTLQWAGLKITLLHGIVSHEVADVIPAIRWIKEQKCIKQFL